jgi:hypothetical protein
MLSQTATLVRVQAILTQLIFEHALRIRLAAETGSSTGKGSLERQKEKPRGGNVIVGRINTLIGADIDAIGRGRDFLQLSQLSSASSKIYPYTHYSCLCASANCVVNLLLIYAPRLEVCLHFA